MNQQVQIEALEHLVLTLIKKNRAALSTVELFDDAKASVMSEKSAVGNDTKTKACTYLDHLKAIWKV